MNTMNTIIHDELIEWIDEMHDGDDPTCIDGGHIIECQHVQSFMVALNDDNVIVIIDNDNVPSTYAQLNDDASSCIVNALMANTSYVDYDGDIWDGESLMEHTINAMMVHSLNNGMVYIK